MGYTCEDCTNKLRNALFGQAFTEYTCDLCEITQKSSTTHRPGYCCPECSEKNKCCEECGISM